MGKGLLVYDPETLEFRRRDRHAPWAGDELPEPEPEVTEPEVDTPSFPGPDSASDLPGAAPEPDALVEKPDGYVDPTPTRRRRKRRTSQHAQKREASSTWRGVMWGVILIMAVLWVYMLYTNGREKSESNPAAVDGPFMPSRGDVIRDP